MNKIQKVVELYREFYRADKNYNPSARKSIQPVCEACDIIVRFEPSLRSPDTLSEAIAGRLSKLMNQIHAGNGALGKYVTTDRSIERQAILTFSKYLVEEVFYGSFAGDVGSFAGKQRGYLEDTCEFIYRVLQDTENTENSSK